MKIVSGIPVPIAFGAGGAGGLIGIRWDQLGPAPLRVDSPSNQGSGPDAGQCTGLAIDPSGSTDQVIYASFDDGGVWKSADGGSTWKPKTDFMPTLWMGAVGIDGGSSNTIYAGTGNFFSSVGADHPDGLFRSVDAGETWWPTGAPAILGLDTNRLTSPAAGVVLIATTGGLFRSVDGGVSVGNNSTSFNNGNPVLAGLVNEVVLDTANPMTVYATVYGDSVYVSTDGGATFNILFTPPGTVGRIAFAQSTNPDNHTMYVSAQGTGSTPWTLYKRTNPMGSFSPVAAASAQVNPQSQIAYDELVAIDPQDANRVYLGFVDLWVTTNGGANWNAVSTLKIHTDFHAIAFSPASHWSGGPPTRVYVGNDGGIATSSDGGTTWTNLNEGIGTNLILGMGIGRNRVANNAYTFAGMQDCANAERRPGFSGNDWHVNTTGDGGPIAVDPWNPQNAYGTSNGGLLNTTNAGASWNGVAGAPPGSVSLIAFAAQQSSVVYAAVGAQLYVSNGGGPFTSMRTFAANLTAIATTLLDGNTLWIGLSDGTVHLSTNASLGAGATWSNFSPLGGGSRQVRGISVDPSNIDRVVAAYDGYSFASPPNRTKHVYLTINNGTTWSDASGTDGMAATNLPDLPLFDIAIDAVPGLGLFALLWTGTQFIAGGLYGAIYSSPDGINWTARSSGTSATIAAFANTGSQLVAVGLPGTISTSPDGGLTWTAQNSGAPNDALQGAAWSGTRLVVSDASQQAVLVSTDGISWSSQPAPDYLLDVIWAGGQFIGVGYNGTIATSPDGLTWTARNSGTTQPLVCAVWASSIGLYVVGGQNGALTTSPDGITWTPRAVGTSNEVNGLAWSGTRFAGVINTGEIITSSDGITWSLMSSPSPHRLIDIAWSGSLFVAVGDFGEIITSPDGLAWTDHSLGAQTPAILAAGLSTVFRSIDLGATWQVFGVGLPMVECTRLAIDSFRTPTLLRVGTYGRSAFELTTPSGPILYVMSNLAFGTVPNGTTSPALQITIFNVGSLSVTLQSFTRTGGSADFSANPAPVLPQAVAAGGQFTISIQVHPSSLGNRTATFQLTSTDIVHPSVTIFASATSV